MGKLGFEPRLESLRGIAALAVALTHGSMTFVYSPNPAAITDRFSDWLIFFMPAGASVVFFFALSGYVLGLALDRSPDYLPFLIRRLFRIFPALWAAVVISFALERLVHVAPPSQTYTEWFINCFLKDIGIGDFIRNLFLAKTNLVPTTWSLVPEVLCSAALPLLIMAHKRLSTIWRVAMLAALVLVGLFAEDKSLQYVSTFYAGLVIPRSIQTCGKITATLLCVAGYAALCVGNYYGVPYTEPMRLICTAGASLLISGIVASPSSLTFLNAEPIRFVGRVSFSFYLLHPPMLYFMTAILSHTSFRPTTTAENLSIAIASIAVSLTVSAVSYRFVEVPGVLLGKRLTERSALRLPAGYTAG